MNATGFLTGSSTRGTGCSASRSTRDDRAPLNSVVLVSHNNEDGGNNCEEKLS